MQPEGDDGMSGKRVSEMTDDEVRDLAGAGGTWEPDAYYEARQAIVNDARAQGKELITRKAWPGACSDITYAEPLEGIRIALTRASAARRAVDDYVKIAREEGRTPLSLSTSAGIPYSAIAVVNARQTARPVARATTVATTQNRE